MLILALFINTLLFIRVPALALDQINFGSRNTKNIALTFDADMTPYMKKQLVTKKVKSYINTDLINYLQTEKIPATLFLTGMWTEIYPTQASQLAKNPLFEIANHSYSHPGFSQPCYGLARVASSQKVFQITHAQEVIQKITGITPTLFRFPGGCSSPEDTKLVNSQKLTVAGWDISSTDAFGKNEYAIAKHVLSSVKNGSIIVFHLHGGPNAPKTLPALKLIVPELRKQGFSFVKVSDMLIK